MCSNNCVNGVIELDYVVLKLNGNDITTLSSYDAVQMFLQAKETIVVELCRKQSATNQTQEAEICAKVKNVQLQSDANSASERNNSSPIPATENKNQIILTLRALTNSPTSAEVPRESPIIDSIEAKNSVTNADFVQSIADHFIDQEHHLFEQCLEPDIDIEEITLATKAESNEELGLTLCCNSCMDSSSIIKPVICNENTNANMNTNTNTKTSSTEDANVNEDVFISDIKAASVADRDGRLRRGDQILRINGIDIKSKKHAQAQMAASCTDVTLLVSRLLYPEDEDDEDDEEDDEDEDEDAELESNLEYANSLLSEDYTNVVDKLDKLMLLKSEKQLKTEPETKPIKLVTNSSVDVEKGNAQCQAFSLEQPFQVTSSVDGKTVKKMPTANTETKPNQYDYDECEHIYETIPEDSESEPLYCSPYQSSNYMTAMGSCSSPVMMATESTDVLDLQQQTQRVAQWLGLKPQISPRTVHTLAGRPCFNHKQYQRISNRVYTLRTALTNTSGSSSSATNVDIEHKASLSQIQGDVDNSSSAYNTGGSNNSVSPRQNIVNLENDAVSANHNSIPNAGSSYQPVFTGPILMLPYGKSARILCSQYGGETTTFNKEELHPFAGAVTTKVDTKPSRPKQNDEQQMQCPQFNAPNLSRYHFVSSLEVANKAVPATQPKSTSILLATSNTSEETPMVWKVKRRPDGTRYIVKRPVRNNVKKNVRSNEMTTTEDDTISEVKIGRYWTKEERKRHIERARERRHQHQLLLQQQQNTQQHQQFPAQ